VAKERKGISYYSSTTVVEGRKGQGGVFRSKGYNTGETKIMVDRSCKKGKIRKEGRGKKDENGEGVRNYPRTRNIR